MEDDRSFPPIFHNIAGSTLDDAVDALRECHEARSFKRKGAVCMHHEFISIHAEDHPSIPELEDLTYKWIELRSNGQDVVCFARAHLHTKAIHVHFAFSGTDLHGKALRLEKDQFLELRLAHEAYQLETYPHLSRSVVYHGKERQRSAIQADRNKRGQRDFARQKREAKQGKVAKSYKEHLSEVLAEAFKTTADIERRLALEKIAFYRRGHRLAGVIYQGKKFRFRSLGIDASPLQHLETIRPERPHKQAKNHEQDFQR